MEAQVLAFLLMNFLTLPASGSGTGLGEAASSTGSEKDMLTLWWGRCWVKEALIGWNAHSGNLCTSFLLFFFSGINETLEINRSKSFSLLYIQHTYLTHAADIGNQWITKAYGSKARTQTFEINRSPKLIHAEDVGGQSITRAYIYNTCMHAEDIGDQSITRGWWGLQQFFSSVEKDCTSHYVTMDRRIKAASDSCKSNILSKENGNSSSRQLA
ncbi:hypothetical protein F0562_035145 [Nyssa sinensis]|uniref:Uncharacterized protein n=1 Tax=Nyssa sinensis TaxID=561372 RepID=A0A5J5AE40_9ASTE|nr:hypothetical protein F0562_035145 [Nyssa sinensis]